MVLPYPLANRQNQRFSERSRLKVCLYDTFSGITFIYTERIWFFSAGLNFLQNCLSGLDNIPPGDEAYPYTKDTFLPVHRLKLGRVIFLCYCFIILKRRAFCPVYGTGWGIIYIFVSGSGSGQNS